MKMEYTTIKNEDRFIVTDFNCQPSLDLLTHSGLFKILWCRNDSISITVDGYEIDLKKNQVIFCTPMNHMSIPADTEGIISFVFNKEFFCIQTHDDQVSCNGLLFFGSAQPQIVDLDKQEINHFTTLLYFFEEDFKIKDRLQGEMLRSLLKRLLIISTRMVREDQLEESVSNDNLDIIRQYNLLVEQHFREKHQVKDYAEMLFKSPKTLSNLFKKYSGRTPLKMIHDRIILEAKRLLLYSDKTTEEIAYDLGYSDAGHFSKFFKKQEELSPSAFKKKKQALLNKV